MKPSVIVVGGGASGMMAAIFAANSGSDVTLIEKNEKLGKKLYISGKGRCNLTNDCDVESFINNVVSNQKFLLGALRAFTPENTKEFFSSSCALPLKTERGGRVFPLSDKSSDVIKALSNQLIYSGVKVKLNEQVLSLIIKEGKCLGVKTTLGDYFADKIIVATGGASYTSTGSTGDGYKFARAAGHTIVPVKPALAPINTEFGYRDIAGLSLKNVTLKVCSGGKQIASEFGEMLFTHEGISGPIVLTISSKINRLDLSNVRLYIDFKPALDEQTLDKRVLRDFEQSPTKQLKNAFDLLLPKRMIQKFLEKLNISKYKTVSEVTKEERRKIVDIMKNFPIDKIRLSGLEQAIVTAGGVTVSEVNPKTMESKLCEGLYFVGEVLDVDALTGGFNIQIAFSTGVKAALN